MKEAGLSLHLVGFRPRILIRFTSHCPFIAFYENLFIIISRVFNYISFACFSFLIRIGAGCHPKVRTGTPHLVPCIVFVGFNGWGESPIQKGWFCPLFTPYPLPLLRSA